ncbi:hypothetical protein XENORESO_005334 [Xenotaenia resolanae]|uniref:Uncharacterized protein n=1 Tax=Xenotaenia resolanae TaxID=208358 RepID=A0ABV0X707_9TELE
MFQIMSQHPCQDLSVCSLLCCFFFLFFLAGSVGGWSCMLPSHTCELSGWLRQLFKEWVAEHSTPHCRPLWDLKPRILFLTKNLVKDSCNLKLCSFLKLPPWVLPVIPVQPDSVYLLSSTSGSQADCHRLLDAQPPKPVRSPTNCLPPGKNTDLSTLKLTSLPNPPATVRFPHSDYSSTFMKPSSLSAFLPQRMNCRSSPEFLTHVIFSSKINIFPGLQKVSACGSKSSVKR